MLGQTMESSMLSTPLLVRNYGNFQREVGSTHRQQLPKMLSILVRRIAMCMRSIEHMGSKYGRHS